MLPELWFVLIVVLWAGYLFLEGFDLGVGMHMLISARSDTQRRQMLNTIGPVWDGNEVWLITAGAATFAAFPHWYAALFSALYLPLLLVLLALIFRAVAIEYRGKGESAAWRRNWDLALGGGSAVAGFGVGAMLALTTTGLPLNANGDREGGAFAWLTWEAVLGGLAVVGFCLVHGATFLALKTEGEVRVRMRQFVARWAPLALLPIVGWVLLVQWNSASVASLLLVGLAVVVVVAAWLRARVEHEWHAFLGFALFMLLGVAAIFVAVFPVVLPSTLNSAWNLTIDNASSGDYTLKVMSIVALFGLPVVLVYQAWSYWVFRRRVRESHIPPAHGVVPAIRQRS